MTQTMLRVPIERQGQTGIGQGGWTAHMFASVIEAPVTIALRSPIPLDTDLEVHAVNSDTWHLRDPATADRVILEATRWTPEYPATTPVSLAEAEAAREHFPFAGGDHPAPHCISCGLGEQSLRAHAGPLGDGRWATPFRLPTWSLGDTGEVDAALLWMAMDCSSAWYTSMEGTEHRSGVTVQFAVDIYEPLVAETDYVIVAWNGEHPPMWEGRKRGAAASLFDLDGSCVAQSKSFWIADPI